MDLSLAGVSFGLNPTTVVPSGVAIFLPFNKAEEFATASAPSIKVLGWAKVTVEPSYVDSIAPPGLIGIDHSFTLTVTGGNESLFTLIIYLENGGLTLIELILLGLVAFAGGGGIPAFAVPAPRRWLPFTIVIVGFLAACCGVLWFEFARADHLDDLVFLLPLAGFSGVILSSWQCLYLLVGSVGGPG